MALDATKVQVGYTGEWFFAPTGSALPVDATTALDAAFDGLGFNTEDGTTESTGASWTDIRAWQKGQVVRRIRTQEDTTFSMGMLETNPNTLAIYYGNYAAGGVKIGGQNPTRGSWVLEVVDGDEKIRIVIPDGEVTEKGDVTYKTDEGIMYPVTISAYPDATLDANAIAYRAVIV